MKRRARIPGIARRASAWLVPFYLCVSSPALAGRMVIESYAGARPDKADFWLEPVIRLLQERGHITTTAAFVSRSQERMPRAQTEPSKAVIREFEKQLSEGYLHFQDMESARCTDAFSRALALSREYPLLTVRSPDLRNEVLRAQATLSQAYRQRGDTEAARRVMEQLIRTFPDKQLAKSRYISPGLVKFHKRVRDELRADGMATLALSTTSPGDARVFINERLLQGEEPYLLDLFPGEYRVFALSESGASRVRTVTLAAGEKADLEVDTAFDAVLRIRPNIALAFADESSRERFETTFAMKAANLSGSEDGVVVLRITTIGGRQALLGQVYDNLGTSVRGGYVFLHDDPPTRRLEWLGAYLDGDEPQPGVHVYGQAIPSEPRSYRWVKWATVGLGAAGVATGAYFLAIDGRGSCSGEVTCPEVYQTSTIGYVTLTAGILTLAGGAVALWLDYRSDGDGRGTSDRLTFTPAMSDHQWSLVLSGSF